MPVLDPDGYAFLSVSSGSDRIVPTEQGIRPTRRGVGGRPYIGPKAQTAVPEQYYTAVETEAERRGCDLSDIWREVIQAGMLASGRSESTIDQLLAGAE